jgi:hypothetical protein
MQWQRGINEARLDHLLEIAPRLMPDCAVEATSSDLTAFFEYWRGLARQEISRTRTFTVPIPPDYSAALDDISMVGPQVAGAEPLAIREIKTWHILHCIVERYGGTHYFASINIGTILRFEQEARNSRALLAPNIMNLEPIEGLGRFFRAAQERRLLAFSDSEEERYFFARYETDQFSNMSDAAKAQEWFRTAPWLTKL